MKSQISPTITFGMALGLLVAARVLSTPQARAQSSEACSAERAWADEYERAWSLGACETTLGHWREARAWFELAHEHKPSARTWWALGKTAFVLGMYPESIRELTAALADTRHPLDQEQRTEANELLSRADPFVGRYALLLEPPGARVYVNDAPAILERDGSLFLELGSYRLDVRAAGYRDETRQVEVEGKDGEVLSFNLQRRRFLWTIGLAAGSAVLAGVSTGLYIRAKREDERFEASCPDCTPAHTNQRDALLLGRNITLGASLILAVGAAIAFGVEYRARRRDFARGSTRGGLGYTRPDTRFSGLAVHF